MLHKEIALSVALTLLLVAAVLLIYFLATNIGWGLIFVFVFILLILLFCSFVRR